MFRSDENPFVFATLVQTLCFLLSEVNQHAGKAARYCSVSHFVQCPAARSETDRCPKRGVHAHPVVYTQSDRQQDGRFGQATLRSWAEGRTSTHRSKR